MKRFYYDGSVERVSLAVMQMNTVIVNHSFREYVKRVKSFDLARDYDGSGVTGEELVEIIKTTPIKCSVVLYRPFWRWSRALAYYKGGKNIYINSRKLNRSLASIAGTIAHEYIHLLDNFRPEYLGHAGNSPKGKANTAPYLFGRMAKEYLE